MINVKKELKFWLPLLLILTIVSGVLVKANRYKHEKLFREVLTWESYQTNKLFAFYTFKLSPKSMEYLWSNALANKIKGKREVKVKAGRIDVMTDHLAIEVEKIENWHEGVGQALHYSLYSDRKPALAIITYPPHNQKDKDKLNVIQKVCDKYDINIIMLMPK